MKKKSRKKVLALVLSLFVLIGYCPFPAAQAEDGPLSLTIEKAVLDYDGDPEPFDFEVKIWKGDVFTCAVSNKVVGVNNDMNYLVGFPFSYDITFEGGDPGSYVTASKQRSEDGATYFETGETLNLFFDEEGKAQGAFELCNNDRYLFAVDQENITYRVTQEKKRGFRTSINGDPDERFTDSGSVVEMDVSRTDYINDGNPTPACFTAGTTVHTPSGPVPIEGIREGDLVLGFDDVTGETRYAEVEKTIHRTAEGIYSVSAGGETFEATGEHQMFLADRDRYVPVNELSEGDLLQTKDGEEEEVLSVEVSDRNAEVYNLQVAELGNYYVTEIGFRTCNMLIPDENGMTERKVNPGRNTRSADSVTCYIPVSQEIISEDFMDPDPAPEVEYELTAVDGAPLPEGADGGVYGFSITGSGAKNVGITYSSEGEYQYTLTPGTNASLAGEGYMFDSRTYTIKVLVGYRYDGELTGTVFIQEYGGGNKVDYSSTPLFYHVKRGRDPFFMDGAGNGPLSMPSRMNPGTRGLRNGGSEPVYMDLTGFGGTPVAGKEGTYRVTIQSGGSLVIDGIPEGYRYEVYEIDAGGNRVSPGGEVKARWKLESEQNTAGYLSEYLMGDGTGNRTATFTNRYVPDQEDPDPPGPEDTWSLTVTKTVTGSGGDRSKKFNFSIFLDVDGRHTYSGGGENGYPVENLSFESPFLYTEYGLDPSVKRTHNDNPYVAYRSLSKITGLGSSIETVWNTELPGYQIRNSNNGEVLLSLYKPGASFTDIPNNTWTLKTRLFDVSKVINIVDKTVENRRPFTTLRDVYIDFQNGYFVMQKPTNDTFTQNSSYHYLSGESNLLAVYKGQDFTLSHGEAFTIEEIPAGTSYIVVEDDYTAEGYTTTVDREAGRTASGILEEAAYHGFTNNRRTPAPTGIGKNPGPWAGMSIAAGIMGLAWMSRIIVRRYRRRRW